MRRRTKIIATIGPASDSEATLVALVEAGMDVARIGLAHGDLDHHLECYDRIRKASVEADRPVGILVDLPGPKVRAGSFPESGVELVEGERLRL
ncbi:MAG: pyruvate kinase, partial [Acidimicrobiales bacterium]